MWTHLVHHHSSSFFLSFFLPLTCENRAKFNAQLHKTRLNYSLPPELLNIYYFIISRIILYEYLWLKHSQVLSGSGQQGMNNKRSKGPCYFGNPQMENGRARSTRVVVLTFDGCWTLCSRLPEGHPLGRDSALELLFSLLEKLHERRPCLAVPVFHATHHLPSMRKKHGVSPSTWFRVSTDEGNSRQRKAVSRLDT